MRTAGRKAFFVSSLLAIVGVSSALCLPQGTAASPPADPAAQPGGAKPVHEQTEATKQMVVQLRRIGNKMGGIRFPDFTLGTYFLDIQDPPDDEKSKILLLAKNAYDSLMDGLNRDAAKGFEAAEAAMKKNPALFGDKADDLLHNVQEMVAISHLRIGEQENCLNHHHAESCVLPIRGKGRHQLQAGSRAAIAKYLEILERHPDDLTSRFLLNVAGMTLGEYPDKIPAKWVMSPTVFASDHDLGEFVDVAPDLGVDRQGIAGGTIIDDLDGDGYLDIFSSSAGLDPKRDQAFFWHNNADGTFSDRTKEAGLLGITGGLNMASGDYDNDGDGDIFIPRGAWLAQDGRHPASLLRNNGNGTFDDVTAESGMTAPHPSQVAGWQDFDNDGWLDLFMGNESEGNLNSDPCKLFRNNGDGTFTDVASEVGVAVVAFVKGAAWGDFDNDGLSDLYVADMFGPNKLFHNKGRGPDGRWRFVDVAPKAGVVEPIFSFGAFFWDYNNDGWLDLHVSGYSLQDFAHAAGQMAADYLGKPFTDEPNHLYRNNGDGTFTDVTKEVNLYTLSYTMGNNFGDMDNDGFPDIVLGTGNPDYRALTPNRAFRNVEGKTFQDITTSSRLGHLQKGHGVSFGDLDNDGDLDIYESIGGVYNGDVYRNVLMVNPGNDNHWIGIKLQGVQTNRAAIGVRLKVEAGGKAYYATVRNGANFGVSPQRAHIGVGKATKVDRLEITWVRTGKIQEFRNLEVDQILKIVEGDPNPVPIKLKKFDLMPKTKMQRTADLHEGH